MAMLLLSASFRAIRAAVVRDGDNAGARRQRRESLEF
jgi:hypothetical protein